MTIIYIIKQYIADVSPSPNGLISQSNVKYKQPQMRALYMQATENISLHFNKKKQEKLHYLSV